MATVREMFEDIVKRPDGTEIIIPCQDFSEAESRRSQLSKLRTMFRAIDPELSDRIYIRRIVNSFGKYTISLRKLAPSEAPYVILPTGEKDAVQAHTNSGGTPLQRIIGAAVDDHISLEEMLSNLEGVYPPAEVTAEYYRTLVIKHGSELKPQTEE